MPTIEQLESLHKSSPDDPFILYGLALQHAKDDRHEDAVAWFDRCLQADASYCYAYYHKARSLESLHRYEDAAAALRAGIECAVSTDDAHAKMELEEFLEEFS